MAWAFGVVGRSCWGGGIVRGRERSRGFEGMCEKVNVWDAVFGCVSCDGNVCCGDWCWRVLPTGCGHAALVILMYVLG